jgi:hypothetical protein
MRASRIRSPCAIHWTARRCCPREPLHNERTSGSDHTRRDYIPHRRARRPSRTAPFGQTPQDAPAWPTSRAYAAAPRSMCRPLPDAAADGARFRRSARASASSALRLHSGRVMRKFHGGRKHGEACPASGAGACRGKCRLVSADLTNSDAIARVRAEIESRSRLDVVVLSSGTCEWPNEPKVLASQFSANLIRSYVGSPNNCCGC